MPRQGTDKNSARVRKGQRPAAGKAGAAGEKRKHAGRVNRLKVVRELLNRLTEEMNDANGSPRVAEFLRLLALEKELSQARRRVREIKVTWVEPKTELSKSE